MKVIITSIDVNIFLEIKVAFLNFVAISFYSYEI